MGTARSLHSGNAWRITVHYIARRRHRMAKLRGFWWLTVPKTSSPTKTRLSLIRSPAVAEGPYEHALTNTGAKSVLAYGSYSQKVFPRPPSRLQQCQSVTALNRIHSFNETEKQLVCLALARWMDGSWSLSHSKHHAISIHKDMKVECNVTCFHLQQIPLQQVPVALHHYDCCCCPSHYQ